MRTKHASISIGLITALAGGIFVQSAKPQSVKPEFEVAEIKVNKSGSNAVSTRVLPSGQVDARNLTMMQILTFAYNVGEQDIEGGPSWLNDDRFDVLAKMPAGTPDPIIRQMVQNLLNDRVGLKTHTGEKTMSVYALVVAKGGQKLQPAAGSGQPDCVPGSGAAGQTHLVCTNVSMTDLAVHLPEIARDYLGDRRVADLTGLKGNYDFHLDWTPGSGNTADIPAGPTIFDAMEKGLGLKIESRKQSMPIVVIDSVDRVPRQD